MGEHPNDKSIDAILSEEAKQKAIQQARMEAQQLRKSVEKELTQLIDYKPLDSLEQVISIYCQRKFIKDTLSPVREDRIL